MANIQKIKDDIQEIKEIIRIENEPSQLKLIGIVIKTCIASKNPRDTKEYLKSIGVKDGLMELAEQLLKSVEDIKPRFDKEKQLEILKEEGYLGD